MQSRDSASQEPVDSDALQDVVRKAHVMVGTEVRERPIRNFRCREVPLAKLELFEIRIDPIAIRRRSEDIVADGIDDFMVATQLEGTVLIQQGEAEFTQRPGSLVLMSAGEPYSIIHTQQSHRLILHIPAAIYRERIRDPQKERAFRARLFNAPGLVDVVCGMLRALAEKGEALIITEQYTVAESLLGLLATLLRAEADQEYEEHHARQSALFRRILQYMEANFTDSELSPEKIAKANGISMRYLHSLFYQAGISVSKWLWERRLRATRDDLLDPNMNHLRISEIAFRRGFNDPAHFSRSFRKRFDIAPGKLRQRALTLAAQ